MRKRAVRWSVLASCVAAACAGVPAAGLAGAATTVSPSRPAAPAIATVGAPTIDPGVATVAPSSAGSSLAVFPGVVTVTQPWVAPAPRGGSAGAYFVLRSSRAATVVAARSPRGAVVLMQGRQPVQEIALRAGEAAAFTAAGAHLALRGLDRALSLGDRVPITLTLRNVDGGTLPIDVNAEVRRRSPIDDERRAHRVVPAPAAPDPAESGRGNQRP